MDQTNRLIDDLYDLSTAQFNEKIIKQVKRCLLDYLGVTLAGAKMLRSKGEKLLKSSGSVNGNISAIGFNQKTDLKNAILLNGLSSHIAELDDGVRYGAIHPGSPVFSALLPLAEKENCVFLDFIAGVVTGYEAEIRLSSAIQPLHYNSGYHPTGTCGTIGSAMATAVILKLSKSQFKDAFSASVVSVSGTLKVIENVSELKPFNVGRAALVGFLSSLMAISDFTGPENVLEGEAGFFNMMAGDFDENKLKRDLDGKLCIEKIYVKPYAACRHAHPSIEAALKLKNKVEFYEDEIELIEIKTYQGVIGKHDHTKIDGVSSAKMSIPYSVAVSLIYEKAGIEEFSIEHINDSRIISLLKKIKVLADEKLSALVPHKRVAILNIYTNDGRRYTEEVEFPKGEPENPLSDKEIEEKFIALATFYGKKEEEIEKIIQVVWDLENRLGELYRLI